MKKNWLGGLLLGVSMALLLAGGVALASTGMIHSSLATQLVSIDGTIGEHEWGDATAVDITCQGSLQVTAYVKNDGRYLYLAVDNPNIPMDIFGSEMGIFFDDEPKGAHDGTWTYSACPSDEGGLLLRSPQMCGTPTSCSLSVGYKWQMGPQTCAPVQPAPGLTWDVSWTAGHFQWEAQVDLAASPLKALPGQTIGFYLYVADQVPFVPNVLFNGEWPCGLGKTVLPYAGDDPGRLRRPSAGR